MKAFFGGLTGRMMVGSTTGFALGVLMLVYATWRDEQERKSHCELVSKEPGLETWYCGPEGRP